AAPARAPSYQRGPAAGRHAARSAPPPDASTPPAGRSPATTAPWPSAAAPAAAALPSDAHASATSSAHRESSRLTEAFCADYLNPPIPVPPHGLRVPVIRLACHSSFAGVGWREAGIGTGGGVRCRAAVSRCPGGQSRG